MSCDVTILAPDATAIVQDQEGNELARQDIASGAQQIITVNLQTMINVAKGDFTGVFDLSVTDQNGFYNDYTEGSVINTLSLAASPKLGSIATVRILGGLLGVNAIPTAWDNFSSDAISQDNTQFNVLTILYVAADDVRIVNNVIAAPDFIAPEFTSAPTATNITETSFDITAQLNENGTVYGYLLADGSSAPTVQEIIDNAQSQFTDSGTGGTLSFTGLVVDTNYDVYVVAEDTAGNRQANSTLVEVLTTSISAETQSVINNMPQSLTTQEIDAIGAFIDNVDYNTIHEVQSYNLLNVDNAVQGWKNKAVAVNQGALYTAGQGFTQQGGTDYVNSNINPSTVGLIQNNQAIHIYIRNGSDLVDLTAPYGASQSGRGLFQAVYQNTGNIVYSIGSGSAISVPSFQFESNTIYSFIRINSSSMSLYKDGIFVRTDNASSAPLTSNLLYILAQNQVGNPNFYFLNGSVGGILISDNSDIANRATRFKTLMNSLVV